MIQSISGQLSKRIVEHYSHVRKAAKRRATDALSEQAVNFPGKMNESVVFGSFLRAGLRRRAMSMSVRDAARRERHR